MSPLTRRRTVAIALSFSLTAGAAFAQAPAQQTIGIIAGRATDEAKKPYSDFRVLLRDPMTGRVEQTMPLTADGRFTFSNLLLKKYLVELYKVKDNKVVCTEGPYTLSAPNAISKTDVVINCGSNPALYWLLLAGAGTAAAIALGTRSASQ